MIQRKQTLWLLLAFFLLLVGTIMAENIWMMLLTGSMALLSLGDVFLYHKRPAQALVCVLIMAIGVAFYILLAVYQPLLEWWHVLPLVAVLFVFIARRLILKDEKLVRSLDRIR